VYFGADADEQKPFDVIYPHFPAGFIAEGTQAHPDDLEQLRTAAANLSFRSPPVSGRSPLEQRLNHSQLKLKRQVVQNLLGFPLSVLPMTVNQMSLDRAGYINNLQLRFREDALDFSWTEGRDARFSLAVPLGLDGKYATGHVTLSGFDFDTAGYANWESNNVLKIHIRFMQSCASRTFVLRFRGNRVKITPRSTPSFASIAANLNKLSYAYLNNNRLMCKVSDICFGLAPGFMEAPLRGHLKRRK
jgi:hypothetical protein